MASNNKRVIKYKKKHSINVGIIIFAIIFIYMVSYVVMYINRDRISFYEVAYGKDAETSNKTYTALILRDETVYTSPNSGYLNLFIRNGQKTGVNDIVFSVDESGKIMDMLAESENNNTTLTDDELLEIKDKILSFQLNFDEAGFNSVYDFKGDIEASVLEFINSNTLDEIYEVLGDTISNNVFKLINAQKSGIVSYVIDGMESENETTLSSLDFNLDVYDKKMYTSGDLIEVGTPIYKVVGSEQWQLAIMLTDEEVERYALKTSIMIRFDDNLEMTGDFKITTIGTSSFGIITLDRYMVRYVNQRYVDIQIVDDYVSGLKIPKTSLVEKEFFKIPIECATEGGNSTNVGFILQKYDENGNITTSFITPEIYHKTETHYYVLKEVLQAGNIIQKPDSTETYTVNEIATLVGVYNINSGYCIFRKVNIIAETSEYYIVESGSKYGLLVYDHIVLDASKVSENQIIYQ